jgi:adenylylsulfate reductase subunit B
MSVENKGDLLLWNIRKMDGTTDQIVIDKKEANKY